MILIYTQKITPRITYTFKQVMKRILGFEVNLTSKIEEFIAFSGMKFSYGEKRMGNEFFVKSYGLLTMQGIAELEISVRHWNGTPCFFYVGEESDIPFDIFSAAFYLLSRYEEYMPHVRDDFGIFPVEESLAFKNEFLTIPVVDRWAYQFKEALKQHFPETDFPYRSFSVKNIMMIAELYRYREKGLMRNVFGGIRDVFRLKLKNAFRRIRTQLLLAHDPYDVYDEVLKYSKQHKISWEFMFQLSDYSVYCKNLGHNNLQYHSMIKSMGDYGRIGLLIGYEAIRDIAVLREEKKRWEAIVNRDVEAAASPFYGINLPHLYNNYDELEIVRDYSMGYPDMIGFRAGTCSPFLYYDLNLERISPLTLYPVAINSVAFKRRSFFEIKTVLERLHTQVKAVDGQLYIAFKNSDFQEGKLREKYFQILEKMNSNEEYN